MRFRDFDAATFLRDHWQKEPLLIRNPWTAWENPLEPDELAGLACEDDVESRLISQPQSDWQLEHGPLPESRFGDLGRAPWTLLVQAVDTHVPGVAALRAPFSFIPNWRIDDVMVSYASDGGGVGAHFDQYDVFLIQGLGQRRWQVGAKCTDETELQPHDDLRLLANFEPLDEWVLEPGDMLYVPPGFAHNGVAVGADCMTYSIGFRAPSRSEIIAHYCDHLLGELYDDDRYTDPDLKLQKHSGEIKPAALDRLFAMVTETLADKDEFAQWFGSFISTPKAADADWALDNRLSASTLRKRLSGGAVLRRNPGSRFTYIRRGDDQLRLFVDGHGYECMGAVALFAERLCTPEETVIDHRDSAFDLAQKLILQLVQQGSIVISEGE